MDHLTLETVSQDIRSSATSPIDVVQSSLDRIAGEGAPLNAFISVATDTAREVAQTREAELAAGHWRGPLHGVPVAVKDFFDTAGLRTTAGTEAMRDRVPDQDAKAVASLRQAGAVIVGKTNMDALGMATTGLTSAFGPVLNPVNAEYVSGGSSAGSAAAVAAGLCFATIDTDAVGSVRLPASCCGVVGFKGSYGLVSTAGILGDAPVDEFIHWMGHAGVTARTVTDAALMLGVLTGYDFTATLNDDGAASVRIGVAQGLTLHPDVRFAFDDAVERLTRAGLACLPAEVPFGDDTDGSMSRVVADRAEVAEKYFTEVDVLLLPTMSDTVPTVKEASHDPEQAVSADLTAFANYLGLPSLSVPCGLDQDGMPIGIQVVGAPGSDAAVLRLGSTLEHLA